ncbi:MAG: response regulator [Lachnospiraceae bacterium]|nr:response regulator [Lachnospiraceae bacterium]
MKRILVADDMPTVFEQAKEVIGDRYDVITASNSEEALEMSKKERPDAILLDMFLDEEKSEEILKELKSDAVTRDIPVIITASDASVMALSRYYKLGAADFVKKPFVENVLSRRIDVVCALKDDGHLDLI